MSWRSLLLNSLPWSICKTVGGPKGPIRSVVSASATTPFSFFFNGVRTTYLVKWSTHVSINRHRASLRDIDMRSIETLSKGLLGSGWCLSPAWFVA